jgi:DNA-binding IclR family transcriptional regulator
MTKKTVEQFEKTLAVLGLVSSRIRKTSSSEINEITGGADASCRAFIRQLVKSGYLVSDGKKPAGYKATEKAKKIFYKN